MTFKTLVAEYITQLNTQGIELDAESPFQLSGQATLMLNSKDWALAAEQAKISGWRWAGLWGDPFTEFCHIYVVLAHTAGHLLLQTQVSWQAPELASHTPYYPGADRIERHTQDLLGIVFTNHPRNTRWTRHQAWSASQYPLRLDFPVEGQSLHRTKSDTTYPFKRVEGSGVYEIPVGPVHAGIIEPGHFRFQAVGETVYALEERLGYVHKGIEKIAVGKTPNELAKLAGRVSGDSTVSHTWAACQAMEQAVACQVSPRSLHIRALLAERERVANHLGDIGAICNDVGFAFMHLQCASLREDWQRTNHQLFGHRLLMDTILPGGVGVDLSDENLQRLHQEHQQLIERTKDLFAIIADNSSLNDRLLSTGYLSHEDAVLLGCTGYVAKASGLAQDLRHHQAYAPYDQLKLTIPVFEQGDVAARVQVRIDEIAVSLALMDQLLTTLPAGELLMPFLNASETAQTTSVVSGLGKIEGWRGEILSYVRFDNLGRIARYFPLDPSWFLWPALERLIDGNIVADFPVCNKSVNGSYAGHDL